jgi:pimeloyl-ACP methyl ester carboxylesterase
MRTLKKVRWVAAGLIALAAVAGAGFWERPLSYFNAAMYLQAWFTGVESRSVQVAGYRIHYYAEGPVGGPPVVLVHGLGGGADDWRNLAPHLAKAGFRVYLPDLPGYGRSQRPAEFSYSVPDEAAVVVGFFDVLGLKQVDLGGWSMGGWIVERIASEHSERVRRLILIDASGLYFRPDYNTELFAPQSPAEVDQLNALLVPQPSQVPGFIARDIVRDSRNSSWVIHRALASMLTGHDTTDNLLPRLKMPVLIVWGDKDRITPLGMGETMHRLVLGSELEIISGCGHMAPVDCSAQIGPKLVEFVKR